MEEIQRTTVNLFRQFAISRTDIDVFSDGLIEAVQGGELNALELRAMIKGLEMILERANKATQDNQVRAADLFEGTKFEAYGVEFTKGDVYTKYDYSGCGDPIWERLEQMAASAAKDLKDRETFLKAVKAPFSLLDESSGEVVTIHPPKVNRTAGLKVSIK